MPDLTDRLTRESELDASLRSAFSQQKKRVLGAGLDGSPDWLDFQDQIGQAFGDHLSVTFSVAFENMVRDQSKDDEEALALLLFMFAGDFFTQDENGVLRRKGTELGISPVAQDWAAGAGGILAGDIVARSQESIREAALEARRLATAETVEKARKLQLEEFKREIEPVFEPKRSERLAVTETTRAVTMGEFAGRNTIETVSGRRVMAIWMTEVAKYGTDPPVGPPKPYGVCPICLPLHRKSERFWPPELEHGPPAHPNCLLPGTHIATRGTVAAMRFWYDGPTVTLRSAKGRNLTVTANHKILTPSGFIRANVITPGQYVLSSPGQVDVPFVNPHDYHRPTSVEQVFESLRESSSMFTSRMPTAPEYFHGDGKFGNSDIDIVSPDGFLRLTTKPASILQNLHEIPLCAGWSREDFAGLCDFDAMLIGLSLAAHGIMRGSSYPAALFLSELSHSDNVSLAPISGSEATLAEPLIDNATADAKAICRLLNRFAGLVTTDEIVDVEINSYSGHVYDLQTDSGLYRAETLLSSNCRCYLDWRVVGGPTYAPFRPA